MSQISTSHYQIFDYWRNKVIRSNGNIATLGDDSRKGDEPVVCDCYCPRCWGCGVAVVNDNQPDKWITVNSSNENEELNIRAIWDHKNTKAKLERCHIIPNLLNGTDTPSNLFLMCVECHQLSPDTIYPDMFFKWVLERRKKYIFGHWNPKYILNEAGKLLEQDCGMTLIEILEAIHILGGDVKIEESPLKEFMVGKIGSHGTKISESSAIIAMEKWLLSIYSNLITK
jgi:hypothetical protein